MVFGDQHNNTMHFSALLSIRYDSSPARDGEPQKLRLSRDCEILGLKRRGLSSSQSPGLVPGNKHHKALAEGLPLSYSG